MPYHTCVHTFCPHTARSTKFFEISESFLILGVRVSYKNLRHFKTSTFGFSTLLSMCGHASSRSSVRRAPTKTRKFHTYEDIQQCMTERRKGLFRCYKFVGHVLDSAKRFWGRKHDNKKLRILSQMWTQSMDARVVEHIRSTVIRPLIY